MEYAIISSRKNEKILAASKLKDKKYRDRDGVFFTEGEKLLTEAVLCGFKPLKLFFTQKAYDKCGELLEKADAVENLLVTEEVFEKLSVEQSPEGIFAVIQKPPMAVFSEEELKSGGFLILENLQNPLNLGAIFRCAYSLGAGKLILTSGCADIYNPKALRGAMGSIFKSKFCIYPSLDDFIISQKKFGNRVICTTLSEKSRLLGDFKLYDSDSFIIGNEGNGILPSTTELCGHSIIIPMTRGAESLNAATACAIVLWEKNRSLLISDYLGE